MVGQVCGCYWRPAISSGFERRALYILDTMYIQVLAHHLICKLVRVQSSNHISVTHSNAQL